MLMLAHVWTNRTLTKGKGKEMIRETEFFSTEVEAHQRGGQFVEDWGYAYGPTYAVWFSQDKGQWVCSMTRYSSCD